MPDTLYKVSQGTIAIGSTDSEGDSDHLTRQQIRVTLDGTNIGAAAEDICLWEAQAAIAVVSFYVVPSATVASGANKPEFALAKGDQAGGALTEITNGAAGRIDFSTTTVNARNRGTSTLSATLATKQVAKSTSAATSALYLQIITNGTPADLGDVRLTFVIRYELQS